MSCTRLLKLKVILGGVFLGQFLTECLCKAENHLHTHPLIPKTPVVAKVNANRYEAFLIMIASYQDAFPDFFSPLN